MANPMRKVFLWHECGGCGHKYLSSVALCPECGHSQRPPKLTKNCGNVRYNQRVFKGVNHLLQRMCDKAGLSNYECNASTGGVPKLTYKNGSPMNAGPSPYAGARGFEKLGIGNMAPAMPPGKIKWASDSGPAPGAICPPPVPVEMPKPKFNVIHRG